MSVIIDLVTAGVSKLIELVPLWVGASAAQRAEIEAKTRSLVSGLDALFSAADAKDDAATQRAKDALK
jgi:hypothetical protein